jgi:hypothetical protein
MFRLDLLKAMKTLFGPGVCAAALAGGLALSATTASADAEALRWSIAVHIKYQNGSVYEHVFATGVPTSLMTSMITECGKSHRNGSVVKFHCYPIPE